MNYIIESHLKMYKHYNFSVNIVCRATYIPVLLRKPKNMCCSAHNISQTPIKLNIPAIFIRIQIIFNHSLFILVYIQYFQCIHVHPILKKTVWKYPPIWGPGSGRDFSIIGKECVFFEKCLTGHDHRGHQWAPPTHSHNLPCGPKLKFCPAT